MQWESISFSFFRSCCFASSFGVAAQADAEVVRNLYARFRQYRSAPRTSQSISAIHLVFLPNFKVFNALHFMSIDWRASLVPAAAVIPAPIAYIKFVAVEKLVVGDLH